MMLKKINWRYALGEIVIVIIGISIAFALNRWAEKGKSEANKKQYLESLKIDLENERMHLENNITTFQQHLATVRSLFPYLYGKTAGRDTMYQKVFGLAELVPFYPSDITYKTLINSGDLKLFSNFQFKKDLEQHYSEHQLIEADYSRQKNIHENYFGDFLIRQMDYQKLSRGDYSFMDNGLLKNIIQSLMGTYTIAIESSKKGIERCTALEALVVAELEAL